MHVCMLAMARGNVMKWIEAYVLYTSRLSHFIHTIVIHVCVARARITVIILSVKMCYT